MAIAFIDADIVAYRAACVAQEDIGWADGSEGPTLSIQQAIASAQFIIDDWTKRASCRRPMLFFSDKKNFRHQVDPTYKGNRTGEKPALLDEVIAFMRERYIAWSVHMLEADDVMGIFATSDAIKDCVIVSIDKDMQCIPAMVFNPDKDRKPKRIRTALADRFWMTQVLTGDTADNYKGIPGVGPKKAEKILALTGHSLSSLWTTVVSAYERAGLTGEDALVQARLARILRAEDYNKEKWR